MKNAILGAAALATSAGMVSAAGLDRSGQGVDIIFERGTVAELSLGFAQPSVTAPGTKDIAEDYLVFGAGLKHQLNDQLSLAFVVDQPWGANVAYDATTAPAAMRGAYAEVNSLAYTALAKYQATPNVSVYGGLRMQTIGGKVYTPFAANFAELSPSQGLGYVLGAAYERPEIALRVALTYNSEISHNVATKEGAALNALTTTSTTSVTTPQSLNLDFQTGVAQNTLVFGSVRWVEWSDFELRTARFNGATGQPLIAKGDDGFTYELGVGRKFSDDWSGAVSIGYEAAKGKNTSPLAPTDGKTSLTISGKYRMSGNTDLGFGVSYTALGNATANVTNQRFSGNSALGVGIKLTTRF